MRSLTKAAKIDSTYTYNESTGKYLRLYVCPDGIDSNMVVLFCSNLASGNASISVGIKRDSLVIPFLKDKVVSAKDFLHVHGGYVALQPGDEVIAYAPSHNFSVIATFEETGKVTQPGYGAEPVDVTV